MQTLALPAGVARAASSLCEFAQAAARTRCALKAKFESLAIRKGHKKSVVALAHKMLRTIYAMLASVRPGPRAPMSGVSSTLRPLGATATRTW